MRILPQLPPSEADLLKQVLDHQAKLELADLALRYFREDIASYDSMTPKFMECIKYFYEARFRLSKDIMKLVMLKAEFGIVGKNWYNKDT